MFETALFLLTVAFIVEFVLLLVGLINIISYWSVKPDKDRSFADIRAAERSYRSVVVPALATLVTGLLISLSAAFFCADFTKGKGESSPWGAASFVAAFALFLCLLYPVLKGEPLLREFTRYPQRILIATLGISGEEVDSDATLRSLQATLQAWKENCGAFSLGWPNKKQSLRLNLALANVPAESALPFLKACRALWWSGAYLACWRLSPWRFGWPVYVLGMLHTSAALGMVFVGQPPLKILVFIPLLGAFGAACVFVYWSSRLLIGVRQLAIGRSFMDKCETELAAARARIGSARASEQARTDLPDTILGLNAKLKHIRWLTVGTTVAAVLTLVSTRASKYYFR